MTLRAVLFDLDGTLTDSEPLMVEALASHLSAQGFPTSAAEVHAVLGPPVETLIRRFSRDDDALVTALQTSFLKHYEERFIPRSVAAPGATDLLAGLSARSVRLAVVTTKTEAEAEILVHALGFAPYFEVVVGFDTTGEQKPSAIPTRFAVDALGVASEECAFVGDRTNDMASAWAAGVPLRIAVHGAQPQAALLEAGATHLASDLFEVASILRMSDTSGSQSTG